MDQGSTPLGEGPWSGMTVQEKFRASVGGSGTRSEANVLRPFRRRLFMTDLLVILIAISVGLLLSSRQSAWLIDPVVAIYGAPIAISLVWWAMLFFQGSYDQRIIGLGPDEVRKVFSATLYTFALVAGVSYLVRADISRAYAYLSLPLGLVMIVMARFAWRRWLYRQRAEGRFLTGLIIIGTDVSAQSLSAKLSEEAYVGYRVVAQVGIPDEDKRALANWLDNVDQVIEATGATSVAIEPGRRAAGETVRQLAWRLDGRGIDLLISPGMLDVAGPRLSVRPAAGLPLLHLDEASLSRPQRVAKRTLDLVGSILLIIALSPVLLACGIAVRTSSPGPVIFRQPRIGRAGRTFTMLKFRSMRAGADAERAELRAQHDHDDPMFKLDHDPRITGAGRLLRRWSLDELPQLFNVLGGSMSLVGPRPHPMDDVDRYGIEAFRRLALKPGMTGLWQVEGRSNLTWQEALQLDLYYVERWSLATDVVLLARTVRAVLQGRGAV